MKRTWKSLLGIALCGGVMVSAAAVRTRASDPTTRTQVVTPASPVFDAKNVVGMPGDAAPGYAGGSLASGGVAKTDMYFTPAALFGRDVTLGEIASINYWTKKGTTHAVSPADWFLAIYTKPYAGDVSTPTWYGDRIGTEPYFSASLTDPADTWNQWTTGGTTNKLRFFESTAGAPGANFGSYSDPDWDTFKAGNALSGQPYAGREVLYFSAQTGSAWAAAFTGQIDGLRIELADGSVGMVNFEAALLWKNQAWDVPANGLTLVDGSGNLLLARTAGTADVSAHLNRILPVDGSGNSLINQNGTPWVQVSYIDNGQSRGVDFFIEDEALPGNPRLQAGSLFNCQGFAFVRYTAAGIAIEEKPFTLPGDCDAGGPQTRTAGEAHTIYVGQRADGTIDYFYEGQWYTSTFLKDNTGSFSFHDLHLRLRGNFGTSAIFTDLQYGDNHVGPDQDADSIRDDIDNCPTVANTDQADGDNDTVGDACDATPIGDSRVIKAQVLADLQALLPSLVKPNSDKVKSAIEQLIKSLNPKFWADDLHITPVGKAVFDAEKKAVHSLEEVVPRSLVLNAIQSLVAADRLLAVTAIAESTKSATDIAKAQAEVAKGDAKVAIGKFEEAFNNYKAAWDIAT